jgi:hypothetical protein
MDNNTVYSKSIAGMGELTNRKLKLPHTLRHVLILVDGAHTAQQLNETAQKMGAPADTCQQLLALGLIAPVEFGFSAPVARQSAPLRPAGMPNRGAPVAPTQSAAPLQKASPIAPAPIGTANGKPAFDLNITKRQLVKLIEKHLGPSGERLAISVEDAKTQSEFMSTAMKTKGILHNIKPNSLTEPFWATIGI